ncbi:MAG: hypothetical protein C4534_02705 [Gaiellales bacterium]|nr:MAG: hypothetical protein C4534_02705 [Gaiellales bacterium]
MDWRLTEKNAGGGLDPDARRALEQRVDEIFFDYREARLWKKEALDHLYLCWLRATLGIEDGEAVAYEPVPASLASEGMEEMARARARGAAYTLLAAAFNEPDSSFSVQVAGGDYLRELEWALAPWRDLRPVREGMAALAEAGTMSAGTKDITRMLQSAYTALFLDSQLPFIPAYESVYRGERQVMGACADAVRREYAAAGLGVVGAEMPDHISHECEFMAHLAAAEAEGLLTGDAQAVDQARRASVRFLRQHLLPWGARLCTDMQVVTSSKFYSAISMCLYGFLCAELDYAGIAGGPQAARD